MSVGGASGLYPVTGIPLTEKWYNEHVCEQQITQDFLELPRWRRKNVILKCIEKPPDNVHSWLLAVIRIFRTNEHEKRLTGQASVHANRSLPAPMRNIPPVATVSCGPNASDGVVDAASPGQLMSSLLPSGLPGSQVHEVPRWAVDLLAFWPSQKSRLVAHFLSALQPAMQTKVLALVPQTQVCVAVAVALTAQGSTSADALASQCIQRMLPVDPATAASTSVLPPRMPASSAATTQLQLIVVAPRSSISLVFVKSFLHAMERLSPGTLTCLPLIVICSETEPCMAEEVQRLKLSMNTSTQSLASLDTFCEASKDHFAMRKIKTFFVSVVNAAAFAAADRPQRQRTAAALHTDEFRFLWTVARCSKLLRAAAGNSAVAELVFAPSKVDASLTTELSKLVGPSTSTSNVSYNGVASMPTVFGTPSGCAVVKVCQGRDYAMRTMDGWCLPVEPKVSADVLDGPISFLNRLAEIAVFQERPLSTLEQQTVDDFTMVHEQTGERRLCSRDWWLKWYGYLKTPVQTVLDTLHPCTPVIFSVTGSAAPADAVGAQAAALCGLREGPQRRRWHVLLAGHGGRGGRGDGQGAAAVGHWRRECRMDAQ